MLYFIINNKEEIKKAILRGLYASFTNSDKDYLILRIKNGVSDLGEQLVPHHRNPVIVDTGDAYVLARIEPNDPKLCTTEYIEEKAKEIIDRIFDKLY